jgi:carbon storage regulator
VLVLTRRLNQSIQIGDDITITIVEVRGDQVRLGIDAPRSTAIYRAEVLSQIQQENTSASQSSPEDIEAALGLLSPAPAEETSTKPASLA